MCLSHPGRMEFCQALDRAAFSLNNQFSECTEAAQESANVPYLVVVSQPVQPEFLHPILG